MVKKHFECLAKWLFSFKNLKSAFAIHQQKKHKI